MFGRKRRVASNPSFNNGPKANASAQTAAALAFLNPQASNASLSAAAAAAALRARPTTPTSVADVQTKRTMRRTNSNSSMGSSVPGSIRGPPGAQLERRGSSGSMTERTFREPSPNRGSARPSLDDVPPVPAIPKNLSPAVPTKSYRRAASMEKPALPRVASPQPNQATGRGSSLEPDGGNQPPRRSAQRLFSLTSVQELTGVEQLNSRGSVNFSYPTGFGEMSPYGQRRLTSPIPSSINPKLVSSQKQLLVFNPHTRSLVLESELLFYEQEIRDAAERPVRRKKKVAPQGATGTHLADRTIDGRIRGTAVGAVDTKNETPGQVEESQLTTKTSNTPGPRSKKKAARSNSNLEVGSYASSVSDYDSDNSENPMKFNTRAGMLLAKKPSVVREDREREEAEDDSNKALDRQTALKKLESRDSDARPVSPSPVLSSNVLEGHGKGLASASAAHLQNQQHTRSVSQPATSFSTETTANSTLIPSIVDTGEEGVESTKPARVQSLSPVRNAHFLTTPESLAVKHQPPARSSSPIKSALKHSPSSRGSSPNGEAPGGGGTNRISSLSEVSDSSTALSDERPLPRKKSVRVSFDDENTVVLGQFDIPTTSDTSIMQSPQGKRGWLSGMGRGMKKDLTSMDDDDDEIMTPRPALPSFGSVREKKPREMDERPLTSEATAPLPSPLFIAATSDALQLPLGHSNDHAVGSVLAHEQVSRNAANISTLREPLPPEVTSVEGSGYVSDSGSSVGTTEHTTEGPKTIQSQQELEPHRVLEDSHIKFKEATFIPSTPGHEESEIPVKSNGNGTIPSLALTRASPTLEETENEGQWPYIPGGFPSSSDSGMDDSQISITETQPADLTPATVGIAEPEPIVNPVEFPAVGDIAAENQLHSPSALEESEESDNDSIYSDAAEDFSDMQVDGFMSLDAVLESPIVPNIPSLTITTPPDSPTTRGFMEKTYVSSALSQEPIEPEKEEDWDKARQYWSGLTAERRKELEQAAREDTDEEPLVEEAEPAPEPEPKPTKKKKKKKVIVDSSPRTSQIEKSQDDVFPDRTYQITPGAKAPLDGAVPAMRSSMRAAPQNTEESGHMRKSMRSGGSMRESMRGPPEAVAPLSHSKGSLQKKYRPMSVPQPEVSPSPVEVKKHVKSMSASSVPVNSLTSYQAASRPSPTLRRKGSAESDSSFKRSRPVTEGYGMKRSMRGLQQRQAPGRPQSPQLPASTQRSSRFSLRSLSPSGSNYGGGSAGAPPVTLGRTLRNNRGFPGGSTGPTLRSPVPDDTKSSLRFPGFGKSKPQPKPKAGRTRASRFADSSDEEDDVRPSFRSRFVDSSDEEDDTGPVPAPAPAPAPAPLPVPASMKAPTSFGGITQRNNTNVTEDDSTDLPDSDDEKPPQQPQPSKAIGPAARTATPTHTGNALASGSLRRSGSGRDFLGATTTTSISAGAPTMPSRKRRGSFMAILRRKKPDPSSKVRKIDAESAARRDTPLERSRADLKAVRQDSNFSTASEPASPKLQKRGLLKRPGTSGTMENWPLPSSHSDTNGVIPKDEKPHVSDRQDIDEKPPLENGRAAAVQGKPDLGPRRTTATGVAGVDLSTVIPPKKKRFGMLRRAFRLDD